MLNNDQQRQEIFSAIMNDQTHMNQFMQSMMGNTQAQSMMRGNHGMMGMMMSDSTGMNNMMGMMHGNPQMMTGMMDHMMQMCDNDSLARHSMMGMMMNHPALMTSMMQVMHGQGMMDNDWLKKGMSKLKSDK